MERISTAIGIILGMFTVIGVSGRAMFVTKKELVRQQQACQSQLCKSIDKLDANVNDLFDENKKDREKHFEEMKIIAEFIGDVKRYMKDSPR